MESAKKICSSKIKAFFKLVAMSSVDGCFNLSFNCTFPHFCCLLIFLCHTKTLQAPQVITTLTIKLNIITFYFSNTHSFAFSMSFIGTHSCLLMCEFFLILVIFIFYPSKYILEKKLMKNELKRNFLVVIGFVQL